MAENSPHRIQSYSVSFCDNMPTTSDSTPLLCESSDEEYSTPISDKIVHPKRSQNVSIQNESSLFVSTATRNLNKAINGYSSSCPVTSNDFPWCNSCHSRTTFYGGQAKDMGPETFDNLQKSPTGEGPQRLVYCVHGRPNNCCVSILSNENKANNVSTIILDEEDHCHIERTATSDAKARRKLWIASILCLIFMICEIIGGYFSGSLAIATDAAHLLTDFASFMISLFALWVASRPATKQMPFGWYRAEVLGALTSVLLIWVVTGILLYVAIERVINKNFEIEPVIMLITSLFGVVVNVLMGCTLHQHSHTHGGVREDDTNLNVRAAFIHVLGDFLQSFGVFVASVVIYFKPDWVLIDPICTFIFAIVVLGTTFTILRDIMVVLMEGIPRGVEFTDVLNTFLSIDGVTKVHNLRIWALSLDKTALSAHLAVDPGVNTSEILKRASRLIHSKFNFFEMTLQIEEFNSLMEDCAQCQSPAQ